MLIDIKDGKVVATYEDGASVFNVAGVMKWVPNGAVIMPTDPSEELPNDPSHLYADIQTEMENLKLEMKDLVFQTSYSDLETKIDTIFADHTPAQRTFLLNAFRVLLYLAKQKT